MAEIDRLEIVVTADTDGAVKNLNKVKSALQGLDSKKMTSVERGLKGVKDGLEAVNRKSEDLNTGLDVDTQPLALAVSQLEMLQRVMSQFVSIKPNWGSSIFGDEAFGSNAVVPLQEFNREFENTAQAMRDASAIDVPFEEIEEGSFRASESTRIWAREVEQLIQAYADAQNQATGGSILHAFEDKKENLHNGTGTGTSQSAMNIANAMSDMSKNLGNDLIKNFVPTIAIEGLNKLKDALAGLSGIAEGAKTVLHGLVGILGKVGGSALRAGVELAKMPFKKMAQSISNAVKGYKKLIASIKRVVFYRTLRALLKSVTEGFDEGLRAVSRYSRSIGGDFAKTMDEITSSMAMVKGSVAAMSAPLISMVAPAIKVVTNAVVALVNAVNQLFSLLAGKNGWTKVTSATQEYDDAVKGASKSQKELTAGMDELNILQESSSGSSSGEADYTFEEQQFSAWAENLKELLDVGKYVEFGEGLANLINEEIYKWDAEASGRKLGEKIQNAIEIGYGVISTLDTETLGAKVATFINSALDEIDTFMLGQSLGETWNRIIDFFYGLAVWTDWKQLSEKVTDWIKGALNAFDVKKASETVTALANGLLTFLGNTIRDTPFAEVVQGFADFFIGIEWSSIGANLGYAIDSLARKLFEILETIIENHDIAKIAIALTQFVGSAIGGVNWTILALYISKLVWMICQDIDSMLRWGIPAALESAITKSDFDETMQRMMEDSAKDGFTLVYDATDKALRDIDILIENELKKEQEKANETSEGVAGSVAEMAQEVGSSYNSLAEVASTAMNKVYDASTGQFRDAITSVTTNIDGMKTSAETSLNATKNTVTTSWSDIKSTTAKDWAEIQKKVEDTWKLLEINATTHFKNIVTTITNAWIDIKSATSLKFGKDGEIYVIIDNALSQIQGAFNARFDGDTSIQNFVVGAFNTMELGIKTALDTTYTHIDTFVTNAITRIGDLIREIQEYNTEAEESDLDIELGNVKAYASGGFVNSGQLFLAREAGAEMVGSIGGRTAVANNDQIVSAVASGVYSAVLSAMSQSNSGSSNINVYLDGKQIEASVRDTRQRRGASIATGGVLNYA